MGSTWDKMGEISKTDFFVSTCPKSDGFTAGVLAMKSNEGQRTHRNDLRHHQRKEREMMRNVHRPGKAMQSVRSLWSVLMSLRHLPPVRQLETGSKIPRGKVPLRCLKMFVQLETLETRHTLKTVILDATSWWMLGHRMPQMDANGGR